MPIRNYEVTIPPTSDEVAEFALQAIRHHSELYLRGRSTPTDIGPQDEEIGVSVQIKVLRHSREGAMRIIAETEDDQTVNLELPADPTAPATFTMTHEF